MEIINRDSAVDSYSNCYWGEDEGYLRRLCAAAIISAFEHLQLEITADGEMLRGWSESNHCEALFEMKLSDIPRAPPIEDEETQHYSDCAVHNEPAYPAGPCDCGGFPKAREGDMSEAADDVAAEIDDWCRRKGQQITARLSQHIMDGKDINDPEYRKLLGQSQAFVRVRSYIHGMRLIRAADPVKPRS